MVVKNVGCCKNPYNGLTVPIYGGAVDTAGKMPESSAPLANMELTSPLCVGPGCKRNMSAVVSRPDGTVLGRFDSKGMALCVTCCADEPLLVTQTGGADFKFGGTTMPCCIICPCSDVHFFRRLNNDASEGMTCYWLQPCASGPSRKPVSHRRPPWDPPHMPAGTCRKMRVPLYIHGAANSWNVLWSQCEQAPIKTV